eukprot:IDg3056t1
MLLRLFRQPGQLYFVTVLKFDIFGVQNSNQGVIVIYGLLEGHWINEKTANSVLSMLHHCIDSEMALLHSTLQITKLVLHADNCGEQNKNLFVLMYLCWRSLVGLNKSVILNFMIAGHTKNVVDGALGHIKRKQNLMTPARLKK